MTPDEHEQLLRSTIRYALQSYGYKPPRTRDTSVTDRYYNSVAAAIIRQLKFAWDFEADGLRKKPPTPHPSDRDHYPEKWAEIMKKPSG